MVWLVSALVLTVAGVEAVVSSDGGVFDVFLGLPGVRLTGASAAIAAVRSLASRERTLEKCELECSHMDECMSAPAINSIVISRTTSADSGL